MFERFHRGKDEISTGSGLGLAIVKSAAEQLEASIEMAAGLNGRGISFCVRVPRN
ncbi:MAG: ATP-binding protein [Gammaproteobacteria bacterium]|nr:ATP-binding protein [Gammaproteobacteria bacterium]